MKNMGLQKNKKGQTLLEIIAVLVIIGAILAAVIPAVNAGTDTGRIRSAVSAIRTIQSAAVSYYNDNGGSYASVSIAKLTAGNYLPAGFTGTSGNGVNANPWSGDITIAENGSTTNQYVVTLTNVPLTAQNLLASALTNTSLGTTVNGTTNTFQATFS